MLIMSKAAMRESSDGGTPAINQQKKRTKTAQKRVSFGSHGSMVDTLIIDSDDEGRIPSAEERHFYNQYLPLKNSQSYSNIDFRTADHRAESTENPFHVGGELRKKADYIISHSRISRHDLRIVDPDSIVSKLSPGPRRAVPRSASSERPVLNSTSGACGGEACEANDEYGRARGRDGEKKRDREERDVRCVVDDDNDDEIVSKFIGNGIVNVAAVPLLRNDCESVLKDDVVIRSECSDCEKSSASTTVPMTTKRAAVATSTTAFPNSAAAEEKLHDCFSGRTTHSVATSVNDFKTRIVNGSARIGKVQAGSVSTHKLQKAEQIKIEQKNCCVIH